tara:strand:+ start:339 stop:665 length:327 start_codon:yes stop_codon:yes gene_type:complete
MDNKNDQNEIVNIEKETLHSSWMRNMFQMITIGIVLLTFFKTNTKLKKYSFIPIIIILLGITVGIYSVIYSYYFTSTLRLYYTWKYLSIIVCFVFTLVGIYIVKDHKV